MKKENTWNRTVILDGVRTPFMKASPPGSGKAPGRLSDVHPLDMIAPLIKALLERTGIDAKDIKKVLTGCVMQEDVQGLNIARMTALYEETGLTPGTCGASVNMFCASSLEAITSIHGDIGHKPNNIYIATGVESMSQLITGGKYPKLHPGVLGGNADAFLEMGITAENVAQKYEITREESDAYSMRSHMLAAAAQDNGRFDDEIVPLKGYDKDDGIRRDTSMESLAKLKTAFLNEEKGGIVTPGSSSQITDGAAAVIMTSEAYAKENNLPVLGIILGTGEAGVTPELMGIGPVDALIEAVEEAGLTMDDIGRFEINEAFAPVVLGIAKEFNNRGIHIDEEKINPDGGAISLGHPYGASGARLTTHLLHGMKRENIRYGAAALCVGGGQGKAAVFENPDWKPEPGPGMQ